MRLRSSLLAVTTIAAVSSLAFTPSLLPTSQPAGGLTPGVGLSQAQVEAQQLDVISQNKLDELGGEWFETFIDTADGERLYTTVIVPAGTDVTENSTADLPVVAIVSPYLGYTSTGEHGPSDRFLDVIEGADLIGNGYAVVHVSTRGTGGSSGCLDILGPGEQMDTITGVEWAASQPWSNGRVGLYGKSYDGNTGAFAVANQPVGLAAVVAQAIAPDRYRGSYADQARLIQSLAYPSVTYGTSAEGSVSMTAPPEYNVNSLSRSADCQALLAEHYISDESIDFWRVRDAVDRTATNRSDVPTFVTAGYLDVATNIGAGATDFFSNLSGDGHHLWVGWWDHVRGNDVEADGTLAMGREGFFDAVLGFFDENLKGIEGADTEVTVAAQTNDGTWREEDSYPSDDAVDFRLDLRTGTYVDDGQGRGSPNGSDIGAGGALTIGTPGEGGIWSITPPMAQDLHVAGVPTAQVTVQGVVGANIAVNLYSIAPDGTATFLSRGVGNVDASVTVDPLVTEEIPLFATDGIVPAGHRLAVFVHDANTESFIHTPTNTEVVVNSGVVFLQAVPIDEDKALPGATNLSLINHLERNSFDASAYVVPANEVPTFRAPTFTQGG